jgi:hypothetical protein
MGGSKTYTAGFRYYAGVQLGVCLGPVDAITNFFAGERSAWPGIVTGDSTVFVNSPQLFGGDDNQGGVQGAIDFQMGTPSQAPNAYVRSKVSGSLPAYRGLLTATFRGSSGGGFFWTSNSPYFKNPWLDLVRIKKGWYQDACWYPEKAAIQPIGETFTYAIEQDMNPAHIIYQALTDPDWGMGYPSTSMDDAIWRAAADQLYSEGFGLSTWWSEQTTVKDFVQEILNTINGSVRLNLTTAKFELKLIRDNYDINTLPELNPSNITEMTSFERVAWGDTANEIVVTYTDREEQQASIAVQDLAAIEAQGGVVVSATRAYPSIRNPTIANRVALRDLNTSSSPMAKVTLKCNRIAWNWDVSDVFKLNWPALGISGVPFRIAQINKGSLTEGAIEIIAVEDRFGLPNNAYITNQPNQWVDPVQPPSPVTTARVMEAPYFDIVRMMSQADQNALLPDYGFAESFAGRTSGVAISYELWESPNNSANTYQQVGNGNFTPVATLAADIPLPNGAQNWTVTLSGGVDLDLVAVGSYFYIDNEAFAVVSVDAVNQSVVGQRAVIDTIPAAHATGAKVYFPDLGLMGYDPTQYVNGQVSYYRHLPRTPLGTLALSSATAYSLTFAKRAQRPYPPGKFQLGGQWYPTDYTGAFTLTWAHRDRTQQTVNLNDYTTGNIGPESGTTYTVKVYSGSTLKRTYTGITTTTWTYPDADALADGQLSAVRVTLESVCNSLSSWQIHDLTTNRHGLGFDLGQYLGGQLQ